MLRGEISPAAMLTYPVLNKRSIDQWSVTELKDELCRRNLPIIGLKDDLVKRLFEDLQGNILGGEGTGGGASPGDHLKEDSTPGSADTTIDQTTMEQSVDEGPSQVATQEGDLFLSVAKDSNERAVATTDFNQEAVVTADEISQTTLVAAAEVTIAPLVDVALPTDKASLCDTVATKRDDLGSTPSHGTIVKEVYAQTDSHSVIIAEKTSEEGTSKKMIIDDLPSDVASTDVKLDATSAINKLDADILEHKALSSPLDASAPTVPCGVDDVATAPGQKGMSLILINSGDLKEEKTSSSSGASICQAVMDHIVDEGCSQEGDLVLSATEANKESAVATTDVNQEISVSTGEVSRVTLVAAVEVTDAPLVDVVITDKISLSDAVATKADDLGSTPSDGTIVKEVHPQADGHSEIIAEKHPEKGTSKEMSVDDLPSDATNIDVVYAATAKDRLSSYILEHKAVSSPPEAIAPHATAPGQNAETFIPKIGSGDNASMKDKDQHDSGYTNVTCQPTLFRPEDQVSEANSDLGSQIKCLLICHDNISTNVKGNLNADSSDLELEAKWDMVKPPSSIPSVGDHLQAFNHDKEFSKNDISLQEVQSTTSMNLDKKEISHNGGSPENLDLDRSSGDEMMEVDVMESKHVDPNIKSGDLGGRTEFTSDYEVKEVILIDTVTNDSSVHTKAIAAEEKAVTPSEKRKPEAQEFLANEPIKRQRHVDNLKIPEQQACERGSDAPKDVFQPALKHSFGRSDSTASGESQVQIVQPSLRPATTSLRVDRFIRPFTLKAVQELLGRTGSVCSFWMDLIKTHCYVTYSSVEEAVATRNAVYNLQWPPNNGNYLVAEFVDPCEVKLRLEQPPPPPVPISLSTDTVPKAAPFHQPKANQMMAASRGLLPTPQLPMMLPPTSTPGSGREMLPPPPKEPDSDTAPLSLDELFKRTQASPRIFYLPLSEEEVSAKLAARSKGKRGG